MDWDRLTAAWPLLRDVMIVTTALGLIIFEAVFYQGPVRPTFLFLYTGMLGLPLVIRRDSPHSKSPSDTAEVER